MTALRPVGYWKPPAEHPLVAASKRLAGRLSAWLTGVDSEAELTLEDHVDPSWDPSLRAAVVEYLARGSQHGAYFGTDVCRFCGKENGSIERSDGVWIWPDGLVHYVRDHAVRPPRDFVNHVLRGRKS